MTTYDSASPRMWSRSNQDLPPFQGPCRSGTFLGNIPRCNERLLLDTGEALGMGAGSSPAREPRKVGPGPSATGRRKRAVPHPGKLKLIATGQGEAAIAVSCAATYINPASKAVPSHSSTMHL
jgi:hypothetical protein